MIVSPSSYCWMYLLTTEVVVDWSALTLFTQPTTDSIPDPGRFLESLAYCAQSKLMLLEKNSDHP